MRHSAKTASAAATATVALLTLSCQFIAFADTDPDTACAHAGLFAQLDRPSVTGSACTTPRSSYDFESGYYQNASRLGGTALAAYPGVRVRAGLTNRFEIFADAPNAIAKSGLHGQGIYTSSLAGFGAKWLVAQTSTAALAAHVETSPPNLATSIMDAKERYDAGVTSLLTLRPGFDLSTSIDVADGRRYGGNAPRDLALRGAVGCAFDVAPRTQFAAEFATEDGSRPSHARAHSQGDVEIRQQLAKRVQFDVELGTAFDAIRGGSKPHYLGSGISFRI